MLTDRPGSRFMISKEPISEAVAHRRIERRYPERVEAVWS
jgi:hypothetical protein